MLSLQYFLATTHNKSDQIAGGVGSIPKPLAKSVAQTLGSGMESGAAAKPQFSLEMVPEGSEDDDE
jgi:hypothetical protein